MAIIRQMPQLYLRGSIASVTMANLTKDDRKILDQLVEEVSNHPVMAGNKAGMINELSQTIRGDYADDRKAAEQEYKIAVWRGLVDLLYHKKYTHKCSHCDSDTYCTKRGKPKLIERPFVPCPACGMAKVKDPGSTDLIVGQIVNHAEMQEKYKHFVTGSPTFQSCIVSFGGEKKYENPNAVLECPRQLKKFFGEFIWNYFRQHIKENKRVVHQKKPAGISGPADLMTVEQIKNICQKMKIDHNFDTKPEDGKYSIKMSTLQTSPEFTAELAVIRSQAVLHGVDINCTMSSIDVTVMENAPTIQVNIIKPEHVTVVDNHTTSSGEEDTSSGFTINQISYRTTGGERMDQDDHVAVIDLSEAGKKVRDSLPDGDCRKVYDILAQIGSSYETFSEHYGVGEPRVNHIAEHLRITTRAVKQHKDTIRIHCLAFDMTPA